MDRQKLHWQIEHIFRHLLPAAGMLEREEQIVLCHRLLNAMLNGKIALCDAGTGIGKTLAYLVAGFIIMRYWSAQNQTFRPLIISTSSITLQTELQRNYIPQLAAILSADGWEIDLSALSVIRKGKSHYVCDKQLDRRMQQVPLHAKRRREELLTLQDEVDMDMAGKISAYDQKRIHVPQNCRFTCKKCGYLDFLDDCGSTPYLFQICNHNLFLADAIRRNHGYRPILPDCCSVIIDEAHKLPETARDMLKLTLEAQEFRSLIQRLKKSRFLLASERLEESAALLLKKMDSPPDAALFHTYARLLSPADRMLRKIQTILGDKLSPSLLAQVDSLASKVEFFCNADKNGSLFCTEKTEENRTILEAVPPNLPERIQKLLWRTMDSAVLVSGTLAVRGDFSRYKKAAGLSSDRRVEESVSLSPFNYKRNCILYFPLTPPKVNSNRYHEQLSDEIAGLLTAASGHALVLFTSYALLSAVKNTLDGKSLHWPVYAATGNAASVAEQFRRDPGSVLLATGSLWEGMNFPGDGVSLLILPRLPFPYPDAASEFEQKQYENVSSYIRAVAVPDMLIKLRQGFGRAIRTETDTCAVAILDERAVPGNRYFGDVLDVLPKTRYTRNMCDIEQFIRQVKPAHYFREPMTTPCV